MTMAMMFLGAVDSKGLEVMWQLKALIRLPLPAVLCGLFLTLQGCEELQHVKKEAEAVFDGTNETKRRFKSSGRPGNQTDREGPTYAPVAKRSRSVQESSIPLSAVSWSGGQRLLMAVSPVSSSGELLPAQKLVVDTGSSTLAFCQSSFLQEAAFESTDYISCNQYNPGGDPTGYWGPFVQGDVLAGNMTFQKASYSIMAFEENMPCKDGIQGIFGIAFRQLDVAYPAGTTLPNWDTGKASCPDAAGVVPPPMIQQLRSEGGVEKLGIFWSGQVGENQGRLYLDAAAVTNEHYNKSSVLGPAVLGEVGWYDVTVQKIQLGGREFANFDCDPNTPGKQCIMDTGTPALVLPPEVFEAAAELINFGEPASLTFFLPGASGEQEVPVSFDLIALNNMAALSKGGAGTNIILGLPLWAFYYTVFDITDQSVSLFPKKKLQSQPSIPAQSPMEPQTPQSPQSPQVIPWPFGPFTGPSPWTPIPGHQPGSWPAPVGGSWPQPSDPWTPFGGFEEERKPAKQGEGRRMGELPVHI
ncbi:ANKRD17 [Symbiodinium sp. CCMP2592]|nr:ANKRD17 [Symbiodinium sp. CCMP2592]